MSHQSNSSEKQVPPSAERWEMYEAASYIGVRRVADKSKVCAVSFGPRDLDAARLVAAAPEMFAALQLAMEYLHHPGGASGSLWVKANESVVAAIQRATT